MKIFQISELENLAIEIKSQNKKIIAIDGEDGAGKSTIVSPKIAKESESSLIHLDDYQIKKQNIYKLNVDKLLSDTKMLRREEKSIVIEGILVLKILKDIGIIPDLHIYVESDTAKTMWEDDYGLHLERNLDEIFEYEEKQMQLITPHSKLTPFRKQVIEYFYTYRPFEEADYKLIGENH